MKIIHCLFAIYLIVLSCLPCADLEVSSALHSSQEISTTTDKHSHDTTDNCSPFCVCNCCSSPVFVFVTQYSFSSINISFIDVKIPEYQSVIASSYFGSIWQPPQINS
jgi:hypothetical protein